jgi:DNA-binding transcriptional LysR family regulator
MKRINVPGEETPVTATVPAVDVRALQAFVEIAEGATFRQAGERLHLERPNVSKLIRKLEQTLGAALLERGARGAELTADGKAALDPARDVLGALQRLGRAIDRGT